MDALTSHIKKVALEVCGFEAVGISPAGQVLDGSNFLHWLSEEKHGDMHWLERNPQWRLNTRSYFPPANSVIIVGLNYHQEAEPRRGSIARYALGKDYHRIMQARMEPLLEYLSTHGSLHKAYVDTGAILERNWAQRSGIGWQGKNTMLIHKRYGNWLFLGCVLTSLELTPDIEHKDHCGTCHRCMDICPTQAITAPYQMDARKCIAYLTIEHKGSIPMPLRPLIGNHLYGCDDCLAICPWNKWAQQTKEASFSPIELPDLREMLFWDEAKFKKTFKHSPILRLKLSRWLRNVCVVLGNIGTDEDSGFLRLALHTNKDPLFIEHAEWATKQISLRTKRDVC